jgi:mono/diheme cytochrome c family protein
VGVFSLERSIVDRGRRGPTYGHTRPATSVHSRLLVGLAMLLCASIAGAEASGESGVRADDDDVLISALARGRGVFYATGGCTCHTNYPGEGAGAPALAGGRAMETPFGVFYSTNITADPTTGLGQWSDTDFIRAMREGLSPEGQHYFPVFPYPSFTGLRDQDLVDLKAYLDSLPTVERANLPPGAPFPFSWRATLSGWKWLNFTSARIETESTRDEQWNRGNYLVNAAAHCGECHTPRTLTGGLDRSMWLAGSEEGPEGELAPNITPHVETGIGPWSIPDLVWYLEMGLKPDGDDTQGLMSEVIEHGYTNLPKRDLEAIAVYLKSVPAIENDVRRKVE